MLVRSSSLSLLRALVLFNACFYVFNVIALLSLVLLIVAEYSVESIHGMFPPAFVVSLLLLRQLAS